MRRVIWTDQARSDLIAIGQYIEGFSPGAARRVAAGLIELGESLCEFPDRGRQVRPGVRELKSFPPYLLRYVVLETEVRILAIRHSARRPAP
ncbi:type II toxin-antitoxin system RelE/ParE family toxin [Brevundimonas sp.]|uniref:type II toxin-antitoxin system RelE/ParE family toxin n=1 Tax=Brevundimonas sp. TaxID=1871086 RepID=UPI0035B458B7